ncbi:type II toxin-antitoxin system antitoxin DhiA [Edwardsiella tarda]|uniref:type II toxin-antitoxin system antitoxin DhiA n=1 Tax=Edwardsiella tarda TaxID=636 RepID=UPI003D2F09BF
MLKIIDVDVVGDHVIEVEFSDGFRGRADLAALFSKPPFSAIADFNRFSLTASGVLNWGDAELSADTVRRMSKGAVVSSRSLTPENVEAILRQATWESMTEGRPDILQAALRGYAEQLGHADVIKRAGIASRSSAYKTLSPSTNPSFKSLAKISGAILAIVRENNAQHG